MKKILSIVLACTLCTLQLAATDTAPTNFDYEANCYDNKYEPLGYGADSATNSTINMSMMGWGLGLAVAIAVVAGVIHQSAAAHSTTDSTTN